MKTENSMRHLQKLIELLAEIPPEELKEMVYILQEQRNRTFHPSQSTFNYRKYSVGGRIRIDKEKKELVGSVPYILTHKEYFPNNESLVLFARQIGIIIPSWRKKKKDEILGRIITELIKLPADKIRKFNQVISTILNKAESGSIDNFFSEWDRAIKQMNFRA